MFLIKKKYTRHDFLACNSMYVAGEQRNNSFHSLISDKKASTKPHQKAYECFHGLVSD